MMSPSPSPRAVWWTRPSVVLPSVAVVAFLVALLTPQAADGRFGDARLSSHLAGSQGGRVLADLAHKLGWRVVQRDAEPEPIPGHGATIHALLAPVRRVTPAVAHEYLQAVRGGDGLLLALDTRSPLTDSLHVTHTVRGGVLPTPQSNGCAKRGDLIAPLWPDDVVHLWGVRWLRDNPAELTHFGTLDADGTSPLEGDAAVGYTFGRGRIVVVGDPDLLRNDVIRRCQWEVDLLAVRMLEWLRAGGDQPRTTLAFDEYHQGYGGQTSTASIAVGFLVNHPVGRAILCISLAGFILLFAVAPRALPPEHVELIERRDPLEQVDALARAYQQVRASRTIAARLVRALRWRVERGPTARTRSDEQFLDEASRTSAAASDVALIRRALAETLHDRDLPELAEALRRVEHSMTTASR